MTDPGMPTPTTTPAPTSVTPPTDMPPTDEITLPDGRKARHKTYGELMSDTADRLTAKYKAGGLTQAESDILNIIACVQGDADEAHPFEVVLTQDQTKKDKVADLEKQLAQAKAA